MIVNTHEEKLNITDYTIDDLYFKVIPAEEFMLCLHDSLGNLITDATVKSGSKTLKFDKATQTYNNKDLKYEAIIEINNKGVYHYLEIESKENYYRLAQRKNIFENIKWKARRFWYNLKENVKCLFDKDHCPTKNKYTGFVAFSKPRYKPGETVKLKAYMAEHNGKPYNKPVDIPIPAGCSYNSKRVGNYWKEAHREHFKEKVVIFSNKLGKGEHRFTVDLIPRYSGKYSLNPAKAELMYFPVFYGNEEIKTILIKQ